MNFRFLFIAFLVLLNSTCFSQSKPDSAGNNYPVPQKTDKMLFYVQRTHNTNTIVYDLNLTSGGKIDKSKPVSYYWIRFEEGGVKKELSAIQKKFAYGLECKLTDERKDFYTLNLVCFKKKSIQLMKLNNEKKYKAYIIVNNKFLELDRIFVRTNGGSVLNPNVLYVDISGLDIKTGKRVTERMLP